MFFCFRRNSVCIRLSSHLYRQFCFSVHSQEPKKKNDGVPVQSRNRHQWHPTDPHWPIMGSTGFHHFDEKNSAAWLQHRCEQSLSHSLFLPAAVPGDTSSGWELDTLLLLEDLCTISSCVKKREIIIVYQYTFLEHNRTYNILQSQTHY